MNNVLTLEQVEAYITALVNRHNDDDGGDLGFAYGAFTYMVTRENGVVCKVAILDLSKEEAFHSWLKVA